MLDKYGYQHDLGICNTYLFSAATELARTCLDVNVIRNLHCLLNTLSRHHHHDVREGLGVFPVPPQDEVGPSISTRSSYVSSSFQSVAYPEIFSGVGGSTN
jgi:hypothetical protein